MEALDLLRTTQRSLGDLHRFLELLAGERVRVFALFACLAAVSAFLWDTNTAISRGLDDAQRQAVTDLLGTETEPRFEEAFPAIVAAAISSRSADGAVRDDCASSSEVPQVCSVVQAMHAAARELARALLPRTRDPSTPAFTSAALGPRLDRTREIYRSLLDACSGQGCMDEAWWSAWRARALEGLVVGASSLSFEPCLPVDATTLSEEERSFGLAGCEAQEGKEPLYGAAALLLPSRLNQMTSNPTSRQVSYSDRVRDSVAVSRTADFLLAPLLHLNQIGIMSRSEPRVVQAYFIAPDGFIRFWSERGGHPYTRLGALRHWSEQRYFRSLLADRELEETNTKPYIDFGAFGFVRTRCSALRDSSKYLYGAFCTDRTWVPEGGTYDGFSAYIAVQASFDVVSGTVTVDDSEQRLTPELGSRARSAFLERLSRSLGEEISRAGGLNRVIRVAPAREPLFVVPLSRSAATERDTYQLLLVLPRSAPRRWGLLVASLLCSAVAVMVGAWAVARARLEARQRTEEAVLQNLQVGAVVGPIDPGGMMYLRAANDRAEELLGTPLPAFGIAGARTRRVGDLLAQPIFTAKIRLEPRTGSEHIHVGELTSLTELTEQRQHGLSSNYFVKTHTRGGTGDRWLLLRGGPFLQSVGTLSVESFAVVQSVSRELSEQLERRAQEIEHV